MSAGLAELVRMLVPAQSESTGSIDVGIVVVGVALTLMIAYELLRFADGQTGARRFLGAMALPFVVSAGLIILMRLASMV